MALTVFFSFAELPEKNQNRDHGDHPAQLAQQGQKTEAHKGFAPMRHPWDPLLPWVVRQE
jgi:hypothetical protein